MPNIYFYYDADSNVQYYSAVQHSIPAFTEILLSISQVDFNKLEARWYAYIKSGVLSFSNPTLEPIVGTRTEIDLGVIPVAEATLVVTDSSCTVNSKINGQIAYATPTGKDLDELGMDDIELKFEAGSGQFNVYVKGRDGFLADKFKIDYTIS